MDKKQSPDELDLESKGLIRFLQPNEIECQEVKWSYDAEGDYVFIRQLHFNNILEIKVLEGIGGDKNIPALKMRRYYMGHRHIRINNKELSYYYKAWLTKDGVAEIHRIGIFAFKDGSTKTIVQPGDFAFSGPMKVNKWSWKQWIGLHDADEMEDAGEGWEKVSRCHELIGFTEDGFILAVEPAEVTAFQWKIGSPLYIEPSV